jgi:hypothetical protein
MDEDKFWQLIEAAKAACGDSLLEQPDILQESLETLSPESIIEFDAIFTRLRRAAFRWDLWAAAQIVDGHCSDDGFVCFRAGLIGLSQASGYGCDATRVKDLAGFKKAATGAWTKKKPTVVVIPIAREVAPLL